MAIIDYFTRKSNSQKLNISNDIIQRYITLPGMSLTDSSPKELDLVNTRDGKAV